MFAVSEENLLLILEKRIRFKLRELDESTTPREHERQVYETLNDDELSSRPSISINRMRMKVVCENV